MVDTRKKQNTTDRRRPDNFFLSILVDLGVTYKRTLGTGSAQIFLSKHDVPDALMTRILAPDARRRLTEWEHCALRAELTRHLGHGQSAEERRAPPNQRDQQD